MTAAASVRPGQTGAAAVEAVALTRDFSGRSAVADVSFSIGAGECLCIFGPNGAGKTTLLRILAGILRPTSGHAAIGGVPLSQGSAARAHCGLVSHGSMLYGALTARENVAFAARLHGLDRPDDAAGAALAKIGAGHFANVRVSRLSRGQQQRVSISRALVHEPVVLLLDEPFAALDDSGARLLAELLTQLRDDGAALVVVTHSIAEGFPLATQCAVLKGGRVVHLAPSSGSDASQFSELYRRLVEHDD